jgi:hypothetical protein
MAEQAVDPTDATLPLEVQLAAALSENEALREKVASKRFDWRRLFAFVFLIAGLVMVFPAEILLWANRTITDTGRYVQTVGPIIHDKAVQNAIVLSATTSLYNHVDVQQEVSSFLPAQAQVLAGPVTGQVKNYINSTVAGIVASDRFASLWVNVNKSVQEQFMRVATSGNTSDVVNVDRLYSFISSQLAGTPLAPIAGKQLPAKVGQIQVVTIPALASIPRFVSTLSDLRWVFVGLSVGLLILALGTARDRRRMAQSIGLGWMVVVVLGFVAVRLARSILLSQIPNATYQSAASDVWQALLTPLFWQTLLLFILGAVMVAASWLAGPAPRAVRWRNASVAVMASRRTSWWPQLDNTRVVRFVQTHHSSLLWSLLGFTLLALLLSVPLTLVSLAVVLVVAVIVWLVLEFLAAQGPQKSLGSGTE